MTAPTTSSGRSEADQDAIIRKHLVPAHRLVTKFSLQFKKLDRDEVESAVMFALAETARRWDPARGAFSTLFYQRAQGAVIDACRAQDPASVTDRRLLKAAAAPDGTPGIAKRMDGSLIVAPVIRSLDALYSHGDSDREGGYHGVLGIEDPGLAEILSSGGDHDVNLSDLMQRLPDRERLVIYLYYFEGLTLARIARDFLGGVCEARVSQLHTAALKRMRRMLPHEQQEQIRTAA